MIAVVDVVEPVGLRGGCEIVCANIPPGLKFSLTPAVVSSLYEKHKALGRPLTCDEFAAIVEANR